MLCMIPKLFVHSVSNMRQKLLEEFVGRPGISLHIHYAYPYKYNTTNKNLFGFVEGHFHIVSISKGYEKGSYTAI
jgi:hypothetical protein